MAEKGPHRWDRLGLAVNLARSLSAAPCLGGVAEQGPQPWERLGLAMGLDRGRSAEVGCRSPGNTSLRCVANERTGAGPGLSSLGCPPDQHMRSGVVYCIELHEAWPRLHDHGRLRVLRAILDQRLQHADIWSTCQLLRRSRCLRSPWSLAGTAVWSSASCDLSLDSDLAASCSVRARTFASNSILVARSCSAACWSESALASAASRCAADSWPASSAACWAAAASSYRRFHSLSSLAAVDVSKPP